MINIFDFRPKKRGLLSKLNQKNIELKSIDGQVSIFQIEPISQRIKCPERWKKALFIHIYSKCLKV